MAATKYEVLYRYVNEALNTPITNNMKNEYDMVREFYVDPHHKIFSKDPITQAEAMDEQQEIISYANNSENPKTDMLFAYDGTKKIKHKEWVPEAPGYVVKDWKELKRSDIGNQGDFSKEFTTLGAATPEDGGIVVCTKAVMEKYVPASITVIDENTNEQDAGTGKNRYYTKNKVLELIKKSTIFDVEISESNPYKTSPSNTVKLQTGNSGYPSYNPTYSTYFTGPVAIDANNMRQNTSSYNSVGVWGCNSSEGLYSSVYITREDNIKTTTIPGHYEDANDAPYLIIDTYKRIQLSPWFVNCVTGSLETAITKAELLVDMIGIENVKIIKIVPIDQFVKIK